MQSNMARNNVIRMNTLHLNSVRLNGIGEVQSVSLSAGADPEQPPVTPQTYTLAASVNNGVVTATRNGVAVALPYVANEGDVVVLSVTPNDGYAFEGWTDGNTDNPRSITMNADVVLSAQCVEVVVPPAKDYTQFEDAEVERVLMSKGVSSDGVGITIEDAEKVTSISTWFKGNTAITSFEEFKYFKNCTTLEASAFEGCANLATLPIEHLVALNSKALYGCSALAYDYLNLQNLTTLGQNALYGVKIKKLNLGKVTTLPFGGSSVVNYGDKSILEEIVIPEGITTIPQYSFNEYVALKYINLNTIIKIETYAFYGCTSLLIDMGSLNQAMTSIAYKALAGVTTTGIVNFPNLTTSGDWFDYNYKEAKLIEGIENLGQITQVGGFHNQSLMRFAKIPSTVTSLKSDCFSGCTSLEYIICNPTVPPTLNANAIKGTTCPICVPDASVEAYKNATNWNQYASRIKGLSGEYNG